MAVDSTDLKSLKCIGEVVSEYKIAIMTILAVYIIYFIASNVMFIYALWKTKIGPISNTSLIFIFMSLSDIVMGCVLCPHVIYRYEQNISLRPDCNIGSSTWLVPQWLFSALSAYTAVLVGVHRYIKVRFNAFYKKYLTTCAYVIISFIVLILLAVLPAVVSIFNPPIGSMLFGVIGIIGYIVSLVTCFLLARQWRRDSNSRSSSADPAKLSENVNGAMAKVV